MHTSVTAGTPRLVTVKPRSKSNGSVQIDREIIIVSSPIEEPTKKMPTYTTFPSPAPGDNPRKESRSAKSIQDRASLQTTGTSIGTAMSEVSVSRAGSRNSRRRSSRSPLVLEDNRQSMQELADFLRTKEPPPHHYMSIPETLHTTYEHKKKSPFKFFQRRKSHMGPKPPRMIQLPDTAVASKTSGGFRHIAISIPLEYDYLSSVPRPPSSHGVGQLIPPTYSEKGHTLRPVTEIYESDSADELKKLYEAATKEYEESPGAITAETLRSAADLDDSTVLRYYRPAAESHQKTPSLETTVTKQELSQLQKDIIAQSPAHWALQKVNKLDLRHSGGTIYSEQTLASVKNLTREPSVSTIAANSKRLTLPPRTSSTPKPSPSKGGPESAVGSHSGKGHKKNMSILSGRSIDESVYSAASVHTAGLVDLQSLIKVRPMSHPVYGTISVLSGNADHVGTLISRPSTAPLERRTKSLLDSQTKLLKPSSKPANENSKKFINADRKARSERVRAKKQKDIALLRESASQLSLSEFENTRIGQGFSRSDTSLRTEKTRRRHINAVSPVMVVANIEPISERPSTIRRSGVSKQTSLQFTHTPPRSLPSDSEDEQARKLNSKHSIESRQYSFTSARSRRQSLLSQHSREAHEREVELDKRLSKIERDNIILLHTLHSISNSFADLSQYLPRPRSIQDLAEASGSKRISGKGREKEKEKEKERARDVSRTRGLESIDPLMRELQSGARVSREVQRGTRYEEDTDYEM